MNPKLVLWTDLFRKGSPVRDPNGNLGHTTGTLRACKDGCQGRIGIRWSNPGSRRSRITWPCSNTIEPRATHFQLRPDADDWIMEDGGRTIVGPFTFTRYRHGRPREVLRLTRGELLRRIRRRRAATVHAGQGGYSIMLVTEDEPGLMPAAWRKRPFPTWNDAHREAEDINRTLFGLTPSEALDIVASSMRASRLAQPNED